MGVISEVFRVLRDGVRPNLVKLGDPLVEFRAGGVARIPDSLAIVGGSCAGIVLLLSLVDDGDTCGLLVNHSEQFKRWVD